MVSLIFAVLLLVLALVGVVVRKTYYYVPLPELKRQAENHDPLAVRLYPAAAYESSLRGLLWLFIALTSAGGFVLLIRNVQPLISLIVVVLWLWVAFSWLPSSRATKFGAKLTVFITPSLTWLLNYLHPILSRSVSLAQKRYSAPVHTGMYERSDLLQLIEQQQLQADSRLTAEQLEIVKRTLTFDDYTVLSILTPRMFIKTVLADDTIGPILIDEIHQSGQDFVLVRESKKGPIVGTLESNKLGLQSKGIVRDLMDTRVYYVHENDSLGEVLHAFFITNHPLFVVVNSFEEYVGILTVENLLRQLLGHVPGDDFDQYSDISAVAARHPKKPKTKKPEAEDVSSEDS